MKLLLPVLIGLAQACPPLSLTATPPKVKNFSAPALVATTRRMTTEKWDRRCARFSERSRCATGSRADDANVRAIVLDGFNGMPSFRYSFRPAEIDDVMAYLHTLTGKPVEARTGEGEKYFRAYCMRCHNPDSRTAVGPDLRGRYRPEWPGIVEDGHSGAPPLKEWLDEAAERKLMEFLKTFDALRDWCSCRGRVNLIGEHIDYLGFPVLPMAIGRHLSLDAVPRPDPVIRIASEDYGVRTFEWTEELSPWESGDFGNYAKAAAQMVAAKWGVGPGFDGVVTSTLPAAAGLSSSSALLIAVTLALLKARGVEARFGELMEILPDGEMFVGTRGGGMDHAICLGGRRGCALRVSFGPVVLEPEPIPSDWAFFVAHSLRRAERIGAQRRRSIIAGARLPKRWGSGCAAACIERERAGRLCDWGPARCLLRPLRRTAERLPPQPSRRPQSQLRSRRPSR